MQKTKKFNFKLSNIYEMTDFVQNHLTLNISTKKSMQLRLGEHNSNTILKEHY